MCSVKWHLSNHYLACAKRSKLVHFIAYSFSMTLISTICYIFWQRCFIFFKGSVMKNERLRITARRVNYSTIYHNTIKTNLEEKKIVPCLILIIFRFTSNPFQSSVSHSSSEIMKAKRIVWIYISI